MTTFLGGIGSTGKGKGRSRTQVAEAASEIRKVLKMAFPNIKFEVKSKNYSGGDSVNVRWQNGPTIKEVERYVRDFEYGSFDGMTDMYNITNRNKNIPQTKYLFLNRDMSENLRKYLHSEIKKKYQFPNDWPEWKLDQEIRRIAYDDFSSNSLPAGVNGTKRTKL